MAGDHNTLPAKHAAMTFSLISVSTGFKLFTIRSYITTREDKWYLFAMLHDRKAFGSLQVDYFNFISTRWAFGEHRLHRLDVYLPAPAWSKTISYNVLGFCTRIGKIFYTRSRRNPGPLSSTFTEMLLNGHVFFLKVFHCKSKFLILH